MIISVDELKAVVDCGNLSDTAILARLESIESVIRRYTNNNFQVRGVRTTGESDGFHVHCEPGLLAIGDTVEISQTYGINDGLYTVVMVDKDGIMLDDVLLPCVHNLVTKVKYPSDVVQCAIDLFRWNLNHGNKVGIKSETLSRHSVTYEDSSTLFMGYPTGILNGLRLYRKVRC